MISAPQTLAKLARVESAYRDRVHCPFTHLVVSYFETDAHLSPPSVQGGKHAWQPCPAGRTWGRSGGSAWFRTEWIADRDYEHPLYVMADTGGCEALLFINGRACGIFNHADYKWQRGDHRALLLAPAARAGDTFSILVEAYAGHEIVGTQPGQTPETQDAYRPPFIRRFEGISIATRDEEVKDLVVDLHTARTLSEALSDRSFRKGRLLATLDLVYAALWEEPAEVPADTARSGVLRARELLAPELARRNGDDAPRAGLIGHSHMDTAWLWTVDEAKRKCARTYSNALRLMEQYPEYRFVQSSALHAEFMRQGYPDIFEGIRQRVAEGRWEPNGGVWVEPDVNLAGGEALIRQFLVGRRFTREHFDGYTSDTFWLPDTFGYSAALPQILAGCGIHYFLTTKLTWNDTNSFPYDTFWWEGIDGTRVFTHFNDIHCAPDPGTLINKLAGTGPKDFRKTENCVRHPDVNHARLISFGRGDGGGGPDFEMLEMARRVRDLDGCPRAEYTSVSGFMTRLRDESPRAPLYVGELYFEGHRGTLTQQAAIKRLVRASEFALRDLDYCAARARLAGREPDAARIDALWRVLLFNQFHDILPGTSIPAVHDQAIRELTALVADCRVCSRDILSALSDSAPDRVSIHNTLGWFRETGWMAADLPAPQGVASQVIETPWGERRRALAGLALPPLGASVFPVGETACLAPSPFGFAGDTLKTPHATLRFDSVGRIVSWLDHASGRELRAANGNPLNTLVFGEDIPAQWDNWDIDPDLELKLSPLDAPAELRLVADGPLQARLRRTITLGRRSTLTQDIVVHARTARIDFETVVDWAEPHRYLGVEFALAVHAPNARHEIQFGHLQRGTHRNFAEDRARFEVSQHKWTDLAEAGFGVALLNDGKYGLSVLGNRVRLSLLKGGGHPDPRGDAGVHTFTYSLLPHVGGFSVEAVVRPAYELNVPLLVHTGVTQVGVSLVAEPHRDHVIETIKPAESGSGVILRLYDAAGSASRLEVVPTASLSLTRETNLLEDPVEPKTWHPPFAIRTVLLRGA